LETIPLQKESQKTKAARELICWLPRKFGTYIIIGVLQTICKNTEIVEIQSLQNKIVNELLYFEIEIRT
jgi:hypothetical protein